MKHIRLTEKNWKLIEEACELAFHYASDTLWTEADEKESDSPKGVREHKARINRLWQAREISRAIGRGAYAPKPTSRE